MTYLANIDPWLALGVVAATALTDAVCVLFTTSIIHRRDLAAANWSGLSYMLSAFAVISFTNNWVYVVFAALGSWIGAYVTMKYLRWRTTHRDARSPAAAMHADAIPEAQADHPLPSRAPVSLAAVAAEPRIAA